jgi:CDGSH-type Zn-finger protein
MAQNILKRAAKYKSLPLNLTEGQAHLRDPYFSPPPPRQANPDDVTDFPQYKTIPMPESRPYQEGKYRPASIPVVSGYYPFNVYLQQGKLYSWCSCGTSSNQPFCDGLCNNTPSRNRPVAFNVDESGYYKLCACKYSANAPFCNGTHRHVIRAYHKSHRGFYEIWGALLYLGSFYAMWWNWYT